MPRLVVALGVTVVLGGTPSVAAPAAAARPVGAAVPRPETTRQIDWHGCAGNGPDTVGTALDTAGAECAELEVPLDHRRPAGPTISIAISRIKAADDAGRRGVLFLNPGGPGVSGLDMPLLVKHSSPAVAAAYDLIGFDPRFTGRSTPIDCTWPVSTSLRSAGPTKATYQQSVVLARRLAALCADQKAVLPYASTRNAARDLDVVRAALGEAKVSYLGYSYGTYLGAVYLQLFGSRVDRIVLDSNIDPTAFGPSLFARSGPAMQAALKNWAGWAARHDGTYRLGTNVKQVLANVELVRKSVDKRPLRVGDYTVDTHVLPLLLWVGSDSVSALTEESALLEVLRDAATGKRATPTKALADALDFIGGPAGSPVIGAQTTVLCADRAAASNTADYLKDIDRRRRTEPIFGPLTRNITPCAFWPTKPLENPTRIRNAHPVLMLNATGDTQTPLVGALVLHQALTASHLVTLRGAYRHGVFLTGGSGCADRTVERYLVDGVLPSGDITCVTDRTTALPSFPLRDQAIRGDQAIHDRVTRPDHMFESIWP